MTGYGNRQGYRIVSNCERKVLADQPVRLLRYSNGERDSRQTFMQKDEIGRAAPNIGRGSGGHRCLRGGKRWSVIQAVTHHQHLVPPCPKSGQTRGLIFRQQSRVRFDDTEPDRNVVNGLRRISGQDRR